MLSINIIKSTLRHFLALIYYMAGGYRATRQGKVLLLMYHRVLKDNDEIIPFIQPGMYVAESVFKKQMAYLKKYHEIISLADMLVLLKESKVDNNKSYCIVTFDDGWRDNYLNAFPILKKYGIPSTIFLATDFIGTNHWFWHEKLTYLFMQRSKDILKMPMEIDSRYNSGIKSDCLDAIYSAIKQNGGKDAKEILDIIIERLKGYSQEDIENVLTKLYSKLDLSEPAERILLDWDEIKKMSDGGISFGSHTCKHHILTEITMTEVREELEESMLKLKKQDLTFVPVFCYPNGNYNEKIQETVRDCGYEAAVTTKFGYENIPCNDRFGIKRVGVHNDISSTIPLFTFHLSGLLKKIA